MSWSYRNWWKNDLVATAYAYQQKADPYLELIQSTEKVITPKPGQNWLDLGCGSGRIIESVLKKSQGKIGKIIGVDISRRGLLIARRSIEKLQGSFIDRVHFVQADFSQGLGSFRPESFDGITAGLCISYAEHWDAEEQRWDDKAYINLIRDVFSILRDDGIFVFSSNVPKPNFILIALRSWKQILLTWKAPLYIAISIIMLFQSMWLKRGAAVGRFHYLPANEVVERLRRAGFVSVRYEPSYKGQAWVFFAAKKAK